MNNVVLDFFDFVDAHTKRLLELMVVCDVIVEGEEEEGDESNW